LFWGKDVDDNAVKTLFLPFDFGELPALGPSERWLFLNAAVPQANEPELKAALTCIQGFRPVFLALEQAGYTVLPELDAGADFAGSLVLLGKHREQNRINIHRALNRTLAGGPVLVAGSKTSGIESMRSEMAALLPVDASWSKFHAQVFQLTRPEHWISIHHECRTRLEIDGFDFRTAPGMFSHKAVDVGSALLAGHLKALKGRVADFGGGWGYLSWAALRNAPDIQSLHLYEADHASLRAAEENLAEPGPNAAKFFHWSDLAQEPPNEKFDAVIMNPPFHTGRHAEPTLGKRMIDVAAASLRPNGQLLMVANRQLPYEDTLQRAFRRFERVDENRFYKIIRASR
jgi:16S rRNA (guanine1207-N2)-methyltransferase